MDYTIDSTQNAETYEAALHHQEIAYIYSSFEVIKSPRHDDNNNNNNNNNNNISIH